MTERAPFAGGDQNYLRDDQYRDGTNLDVRASLRKRLRFVADETEHEYRDVDAVAWGERFHDQDWVNPAVVNLLRGV